MVETDSQDDEGQPRDIDGTGDFHWSRLVLAMDGSHKPDEALGFNVTGRKLTSPLQGFGQLWQKTYKVRLPGVDVTPQQVIEVWKKNLPVFMPENSRFYPSLTGVKPGEVIWINASIPTIPGGFPVSTGVLVIYADDQIFTVMTPMGHPLSGFNSFSAYIEDGAVVAQVQGLLRATDPIYEFGFHFLGGFTNEDRIWEYVLTSLAAYYGVKGLVQMDQAIIDKRVQWSQVKNVWYNAIIRTMLFSPYFLAKRLFKRSTTSG